MAVHAEIVAYICAQFHDHPDEAAGQSIRVALGCNFLVNCEQFCVEVIVVVQTYDTRRTHNYHNIVPYVWIVQQVLQTADLRYGRDSLNNYGEIVSQFGSRLGFQYRYKTYPICIFIRCCCC